MEPLVSTIIAAYNAETTLIDAVQSVLNQTYPNWELIVVDDASTDRTRILLESLQDSRIRTVFLQKNQGPSFARNTGCQHANGDYFAFLDADDCWLPEKLSEQVKVMAETTIGFSYCNGLVQDIGLGKEFLISQRNMMPAGDAFSAILFGNPMILPSGMMMRREIFFQCGMFDPEIRFMEDWDFCLRISRQTKIGYLKAPLFRYRMNVGNISRNTGLKEEHYQKILKKLAAECDSEVMDILYNKYHLTLGFSWLLETNRLAARNHFLQCRQSFQTRKWLGFVLTFIPVKWIEKIILIKKNIFIYHYRLRREK